MTETRTRPPQIDRSRSRVIAARARLMERDLVRIAMIKRGLSRYDLARRCGVAPVSVTNWISNGFAYELSRWKVEAGFDYREPIFSTAGVLKIRRRCLDTFGFDPYLVSRPRLLAFAQQLGFHSGRARHSLDQLRDAVVRHFAANPKLLVPNTPAAPATK